MNHITSLVIIYPDNSDIKYTVGENDVTKIITFGGKTVNIVTSKGTIEYNGLPYMALYTGANNEA